MKVKEDAFLESNFSVNYCSDVVGEVFGNIKKAESFSLVGVKDVNKSNLLRFVTLRKDIQRRYLGREAGNYLFVFVDLNELIGISPLDFYQLVSISIAKALEGEKIKIGGLSNDFVSSPTVFFGVLRRDVLKIANETGKILVLIFNNFDKVRNLDLADSLVALRQTARFRIVYIFSLTRPVLADAYFFHKTVWRRPFEGVDAGRSISRNLRRFGFTAGRLEREKILTLSGGHPGLIKFITQNLGELNKFSVQKWLELLLKNDDIQFQCERILSSLTAVERAKLKVGEKEDLLRNLGLQVERKGESLPFSPIVGKYLSLHSKFVPAFYLSEEGEVYFWGRPINKSLTEREIKLLAFLILSPEKVFGREEIIKAVWGEEVYPTDWAFDQMTSRLRRKLNDGSNQVRYLKTVRGAGIILQ